GGGGGGGVCGGGRVRAGGGQGPRPPPAGGGRAGAPPRRTRSAVTSIGRPNSLTFAAASGSGSMPATSVPSALTTDPRVAASLRVAFVSRSAAYSAPSLWEYTSGGRQAGAMARAPRATASGATGPWRSLVRSTAAIPARVLKTSLSPFGV